MVCRVLDTLPEGKYKYRSYATSTLLCERVLNEEVCFTTHTLAL